MMTMTFEYVAHHHGYRKNCVLFVDRKQLVLISVHLHVRLAKTSKDFDCYYYCCCLAFFRRNARRQKVKLKF